MFKKTLIAVAVMVGVTAPALADVSIENASDFNTTSIAYVTKQPTLSFSTAQEDVPARFGVLGDVKQNGFITVEIKGDGTFNASEVRQWLTKVGGAYKLQVRFGIYGGPVSFTDSAVEVEKLFKVTSYGGDTVIEHALDQDGKRLRLAVKETTAFSGETCEGNVGQLPAAITGDATANPDNLVILGASTVTGLDVDGKCTADSVSVQNVFGAGHAVKFPFTAATNIFNLKSGATSSEVLVKVGAMRNSSYTADPKATPTLFKLGELFKLEMTTAGKATALVATGFLQTDKGQLNIEPAGLKLVNKTTNQNIQLNKVKLTATGDFSGFRQDADGNLLNKDSVSIGWKVADGVASTVAGNTVLEGNTALTASEAINLLVSVAADNAKPIQAQEIGITAKILGADQDTFEDYEDTLAKVLLIGRDGMKFDTITTGTTSSNTVHIRDISGVLPTEGGKIFVTITEYADHSANGRGEGTVMVERKPLSITLPNKGAVTLKPADIAADLGVALTSGRQARFLFEVETNKGEVAVKKSNSEGTDVQNGTRGVEAWKSSLEDGATGGEVDFTL
ncbi:S-layer protein [Aeromonas salmonicida]|uniref:VapA family S-layer protein n=1 Tax=Aeromonas salmonicida TaxID=645 RepID=UPI002240D7A1|nr:S-layer protein [Aeromonas salmonicida]